MTKRKRNSNKVLVLSPSNPLQSARHFISYYYTEDRFRTLHRHKGGFYTYTGTHYRETGDEDLNSQLYDFLDKALRPDKDKGLVPFEPTKWKVSEVLEALKAEAFLRPDIEVPMWLDDSNPCSPHELLACQNGLLYLPSQILIEHTPVFFGCQALPFEYDPEAPDPKMWLEFLGQLWPEDPESIRTLQEWFGYCLSSDTRQQKILLIVGPKRSGKGTIGRIERGLLGAVNVCAPTLSSLSKNFGLQPLIGKYLAIVSDARLGKRADQSTVAERLLSISGEDALTIDRKYREAWSGTLPTRFMILTNELPRIWDASGALASRFIVLVLTESFFGREDIGLTDRLATEVPGILNWAIEGWIRLNERGHFLQPESAAEATSELEDLGSPISAFLRDRCEIGPKCSVSRNELYEVWGEWCKSQGYEHPSTKETLGRDLRAAVPGIKSKRRRTDGVQKRYYLGVGLKARKPGSLRQALGLEE